MNTIVQFKQYTCRLVLKRYANSGFPHLQLVDAEDGSPIATATINVLDFVLPPNHCIIKDYSENQGMIEALATAGVLTPVQQIELGCYRATAHLCLLAPHLINAIDD